MLFGQLFGSKSRGKNKCNSYLEFANLHEGKKIPHHINHVNQSSALDFRKLNIERSVERLLQL